MFFNYFISYTPYMFNFLPVLAIFFVWKNDVFIGTFYDCLHEQTYKIQFRNTELQW